MTPLWLPTIAAGTAGPAAAGTAAPISETDNGLNLSAAAAAPATTEQSTQMNMGGMKMGGYDDGGEFIVPHKRIKRGQHYGFGRDQLKKVPTSISGLPFDFDSLGLTKYHKPNFSQKDLLRSPVISSYVFAFSASV